MRPFAALLLCLPLLAATCETKHDRVAFDSAPSTEVPVPVIATCVEPAQIPAAPASAMQARGADVGRQAAGASADLRTLRAQNAKLRAMLLACAAPKP